MARPKRTILLETTETDLYDLLVTAAEGYWIVEYDKAPFKLVRNHKYLDKYTYSRTGFPEPGHARNLARKLNQLFATDLFTVRKIV